MLAVPVGLLVLSFTNTTVNADSFKAKYYKECYQPITANIKASEPAKEDVGRTRYPEYDWARNTKPATKVVKNRDVITDVPAFRSKMVKDNPEPNARFQAYSRHIIKEADDLDKKQAAVGQTQDCYRTVYKSLKVAYKNNRLMKKDTQKMLKEIQEGTEASGDFLVEATNRMETNIAAYAEAIKGETDTLGLNLTSARKIAGLSEKSPTEGKTAYGTFTNLAEFSKIKARQSADLTAEEVAAISPAAGGDDRLSEEDKVARMMLPGLQQIGVSSVTFLALHSDILARVEAQKALESQVAVMPW